MHRQRPFVPGPAVPVLLALAVGASGCSSLAERSARKELVVVFADEVASDDVARVRERCDGYPGVVQEPAGSPNAANRRYPLRYDVTRADTRAFADLAGCLAADPSVRSYTVQGGVGG